MIRVGLVLLLATVVVVRPDPASDIKPELRIVLSDGLKFSPQELAELERGRIVKHDLDSGAPGEVAVVGAARVRVRKETFLDRFRDIARFKRGAEVLEIGRFSNPPVPDDLAPLTVGREDLDVRTCRVADCDVRLSADAIVRFRREIDWTASDADARAAALYKRILFDNVRAYLTGSGQGRITEYNDEKRPIRPLVEFAGLLNNSPYIGGLVPGLPEHLEAFPTHSLPDAEDFLYWSKEKFGFTPFITITHVTIARTASGTYVMTSKDVYSSRYFDASLGLTIASDAGGTADAFYLVYSNRSRANALKGSFGGLRRAIVERRGKNSLAEHLRTTRMRLENRMR